jgi:predicted heme/steroid binding protein/uncharacterized membrane protein
MENKPKYFTQKQLKEFDGKSGKPAYVAFKGKVYDVLKSPFWEGGEHTGRHFAGFDITLVMINAPHSEEVLRKFPVVGEMKEESKTLKKRLEKLHIHSMLVHFSIAFAFGIILLDLIYLITKDSSLEKASYYLLILLLIITPFSGLSGFFSFKVTYEGRRSRIFDRKIIFSIALAIMVIGCVVWRILVPDIWIEQIFLSYIYFIFLIGIAGITAILGHYGGKISYS